jgi:hypothetical protein
MARVRDWVRGEQNSNLLSSRYLKDGLSVLTQSGGVFSLSGEQEREIDELRLCLEKYLPGIIDELISCANSICDHRFRIFGREVRFGEGIDWHNDPFSGFKWPLVFYADVRHSPSADQTDIKNSWELNRFYHSVTLGQAYALTGRAEYCQEFEKQIISWIEGNPLNRGVNWNCSMEVALRAINLLWAYTLFAGNTVLSDEFRLVFGNMMVKHGEHIYHNLENKSVYKGNHYVADLLGLLYISRFFPTMRYAEKWRRFATRELIGQMAEQVNEDGTNFEASIPYHRLVCEMFLHACLLEDICGRSESCGTSNVGLKGGMARIFTKDFLERLEKMCEFTLHYTKPNGLAPQIGDNDDGRVVKLGRDCANVHDHRHILAVAGECFDRDEFRMAGRASYDEAIWIFSGNVQVPKYNETALHSRAFPDGGIYIMRKDSDYLIVRCGDLGTGGKGSHTHNDCLSFELCAGGKDYIVDPGSYTYSGDPAARNLMRSTGYHNTVVIDGREQNQLDEEDLFVLKRGCRPRVLMWKTNQAEDVFCGKCSMTLENGEAVSHVREIRFDKFGKKWKIHDKVEGNGVHKVEWNFHAAEKVFVGLREDSVRFETGKDLPLVMLIDSSEEYKCETKDGWVSPSYGVKKESTILTITVSVRLPIEMSFGFLREGSPL